MSTRTVAARLLIKPNTSIWSTHPERLDLIGALPEGVDQVAGIDEATTALLFADSEASLRATVVSFGNHLTTPPFVWFLYPKGGRADINRDTLWPIVAEYGVRPITQIAVDDTWSALRFRPLKEGEAPFTGGQDRGRNG